MDEIEEPPNGPDEYGVFDLDGVTTILATELSTTKENLKSPEDTLTRGLKFIAITGVVFLILFILRKVLFPWCREERERASRWQLLKSSIVGFLEYFKRGRTEYLFQQPSHLQFLQLQSLMFRLMWQSWFFSLFATMFNAMSVHHDVASPESGWFERMNQSNLQPGDISYWFQIILVLVPASFAPLYHIRRHIKRQKKKHMHDIEGRNFFHRQDEESLQDLRVPPGTAVPLKPTRWLMWILVNALMVAVVFGSSYFSAYIINNYLPSDENETEENKSQSDPFYKQITAWGSQLVTIISQVIIYFALLYSSTMDGQKVKSGEFLLKLFVLYFLIVAVLPTVGASSLYSLVFTGDYKKDDWEKIFLPTTGGYFINYVITVAIFGTIGDILSPASRLIYWYRRLLWKPDGEPCQIELEPVAITFFEERLATQLAHFALVVMYSVSCPLISSAGIFYFALQRFAVLHKLDQDINRRPVCAVEHLDWSMVVWVYVIIVLTYTAMQITVFGFSYSRLGFQGPSIFILFVIFIYLIISALINWNFIVPYLNVVAGRRIFQEIGTKREKGVPILISFKSFDPDMLVYDRPPVRNL